MTRIAVAVLVLVIALAADGQVIALTLGQPQDGTFTFTDQAAWYQVNVGAGEHLAVVVRKSSAWYGSVYVRHGVLPTTYEFDAASDYVRGSQGVGVSPTLAGTYFIMVQSDNGYGGFSVTAYSDSTWTPLTPGANPTEGTLDYTDDAEWYQTHVAAGDHLAVIVHKKSAWYGSVYIRYGVLPTTNDYDVISDYVRGSQAIDLTASQSGMCYVMVRSDNGYGDYDIRAYTDGTWPPLTDSFDTLDYTDDADWYRAEVGADQHLTVTVQKDAAWYGSLYLHHGALPTTVESDASSEYVRGSQAVDIPITQAGTYYVMLRSDNGYGSYTITAQVDGYEPPEGVQFEDPRLEAAVRETLGIPSAPIYVPDLLQLTRLNAPGRGIQSLTGLELDTALVSLNVSYNQLEKIDALLWNESFAEGASVELYGNPLTQTTICDDLPVLEARGVAVGFNGACDPPDSGRLTGFVREAVPPQNPVSCAAVLVTEDEAVVGTAVVDIGGYYEISGLLQGTTYSLLFASPGYTAVLRDHTLLSEQDEVSVTMAGGSSARVSGFVIDDSAEAYAVAGALVRAWHNGIEIARTVSCASGAFEFQALDLPKATTVTVEASAPGYSTQTVEVEVDQPDPVEVPLPKLMLPGSIVGTVADDDGVSMAGAEVVVQQVPAGFNAVRTTTDEGGYSVSNVPDGDYEARAVMSDTGWGMNSGSVYQDLAQIDIEILRDGTGECVPPEPPASIHASDGTDSTCVVVSWASVSGVDIEYQVLRCATSSLAGSSPVSGWITEPLFEDTSAAPPTITSGSGCNGGNTTTYHTYYYWVIARESGATCSSDPTSSDSGYRGDASKNVQRAGSEFGIDAILIALVAVTLATVRTNATRRCRR